MLLAGDVEALTMDLNPNTNATCEVTDGLDFGYLLGGKDGLSSYNIKSSIPLGPSLGYDYSEFQFLPSMPG